MMTNMPIKLTKRIENLERQLNVREKIWKVWDVKSENKEEKIADIKAGKVVNSDGTFYSKNDVNYFLDFDFVSKCLRKSGQKYANTKN